MFSDGQKIAKKLAIQISNETKCIKSLLAKFSNCHSATQTNDLLIISEALDPSIVESKLQGLDSSYTTLASGKKREIINSYLSLCRIKRRGWKFY